MTMHNYKPIIKHYETCLDTYGVSLRGMDWPNDDDAWKRYAVMAHLILPDEKNVSVLDLGCGAGFFLDYLKKEKRMSISYRGLDASEKMIDAAHRRYPNECFDVRDILVHPLDPHSVDYVIMNGVLTEKVSLTHAEMEEYAKTFIVAAYAACKRGIAFNVMSTHVDWMRDDLFHWALDDAVSFLMHACSRHVVARMDYGLYEYTFYVYRSMHI